MRQTKLKISEPSVLVELRNGIPVWVHPPQSIPVTSEMVRELMDQADADEFVDRPGEESGNL